MRFPEAERLADLDRFLFFEPPPFLLGLFTVIGAGYSPANRPVLSTFMLNESCSGTKLTFFC